MLRQQLVELVAQNLVGEVDSLEQWHQQVFTPPITPEYAQPRRVLPTDCVAKSSSDYKVCVCLESLEAFNSTHPTHSLRHEYSI